MTTARPADGASRPTQVVTVDDSAQIVDGVDVDAVVAAVTGCPTVSGMASGILGTAATLLPGRKVPGITVAGGQVRVEVRARWGVTAAVLAQEIRVGTAALLAGHQLHVVIADIDDPPVTAPPGVISGAPEPVAPTSPLQRELS